MGKYSDILIMSDIDGTFIDDNLQIPQANIDALNYFRSEGGKFTVCTGRVLQGALYYLERLKTDAPMICLNGSAIYDFEKNEFVWLNPLPESTKELIMFVEEKYPDIGIEIMTPHHLYVHKDNEATRIHKSNEDLTMIYDDFRNITSPWAKVVFADMSDRLDVVQAFLEKTKYNSEYKLIRSYPIFYEAVNKTTNKGVALAAFCEMLKLDYKNIYVVGDNDNDVDMLMSPARSFAPSSASENAKKPADIVLKNDNNKGVLPEILKYIDSGL